MNLTLPHLDTTSAQHLLEGLQGVSALPTDDVNGDHHASLAASIAYSFQHLSSADQQALTVLSLFHGVAFTLVLGLFINESETPERFRDRTAGQLAELLEGAANLGLLTALGDGMFRLHPALPAHLAAQWRTCSPDTHAAERAAALDALISAHATLSTWLNEHIHSGNAKLALTLIGVQQQMLGAMLGHALARHRWADAQTLLQPLDTYWSARGSVAEARSWLDRVRLAIETPDGVPPALDSPAGSLWLSVVMTQAEQVLASGQLDRAESTYRSILRTHLQHPASPQERRRVADINHQLGTTTYLRGQLEEAEEWYGRALTTREELGNRPGMASSYHQLGMVAQDRGRLEEAEEWYRQALTINEDLGNRPDMASTYGQLRLLAEAQADTAQALAWTVRCVSLFDEIHHPSAGPGYFHLRRLTAQLGVHALERAWQDVLSEPLPANVRNYVLTDPADND
ncbi:tetratricopeptide repeat protein [Streptomyces sp. NPDC003032]